MKIRDSSFLSKFLQKISWFIYHKLENHNNPNFSSNGEAHFLKDFLSNHQNQKVTVWDVGANVGNWAETFIQFASKWKVEYDLHLFEPTQECLGILQSKFSNNSNVTIHPYGLSDTEKETSIFYDKAQSGLASLYERDLAFLGIDRPLSEKETIQLKKGVNIIEEFSISHIHLMKTDVEGHELQVFESLEKYLHSSFIDMIQFEYGGTNLDARSYLKDYFKLLQEKGYQLFKMMPKSLRPQQYQLALENFQYANYVALNIEVSKNN